jgi:DNA-binding transcriptional ArsR family regulator
MSVDTDFRTEHSLTRLFQKVVGESIPNGNGTNHSIVLSEFSAKRGRADVICAIFEKEIEDIEKTKTLARSLSEINKARIMSLLRKSVGYNEGYLEESLGLSKGTIKKHLRDLLNAGVIERTPRKLLKLSKSFNIPKVEIWAFELKLNNWKRAFHQAKRYRGFSHNVVVVMPNGRLTAAKDHIDYFRGMNVGLAGISKDGKLDYILKPKRKRPSSKGHYLYSVGKILTRYGNSDLNAATKVKKGRSPT